jgi:Rieske 2Fe-2S family protein
MRVPALDRAALEQVREPLERARQLPAAAFTDPEVLGWEREHVFRRGWVCAGHAGALAERGAFLTVDDVLVVTGEEPRAFFNACRHRGARLLDTQQRDVHAFDGMVAERYLSS